MNLFAIAQRNSTGLQLHSTDFGEFLFHKFLDYTDVKKTTLQSYAVHLRQFFKWIRKEGIKNPQREDIKAYKSNLDKQEFTAGTQAQYLRAVKHFFKWTASEGLYPNIADNIKGTKVKHDNTKKEAFTEDGIKEILKSIDTSTQTGKRDYIMILLSVTGGLRIIEMQRANINDLQTIKGQKVLYIQGKGHNEKDDYVKIVPELAKAIDEYLRERPKSTKKNEPLFIGTGNRAKGKRLTEPSISRIIKGIFKKAGYDCDRLTAHSLRHTSNTLLFKSGADLYKVQQHARHTDPKTTQIYIHAVNKEADQSEQQIYNQIFNQNKFDTAQQCFDKLKTMPEDMQIKVYKYITSLETQIKIGEEKNKWKQ